MAFTDSEAGTTRSRDMAVTQENFPVYKSGANYSDIKKIKEYAELGYDSFQIAHFIAIVESCVASHMKPPRKKPGPKPKESVAA